MKCFDLQVNGAFGVDFSEPSLTAEEFLRCADAILKTGVTRFLPTIITSSTETYTKLLPMIVKAVRSAGLEYEIPGLHLEGPFISPEPGAVGAHNPQWVAAPSPEALHRLADLAEGKIALMTFAAERPGATETISEAHKMGIAVSLGHQLANGEQMAAAGADALTHLGNGIPNLIHRHHNPIWSGLANDDLTAMIITDGHHLPPEVIKCIIKIKGAEKTIITSDASPAAGLPPGKYYVLGNNAVMEENGKLHNPEKQCLVGSGVLMPRCIEFLRSLNIVSDEELEQLCWTNPHRLIKLQP